MGQPLNFSKDPKLDRFKSFVTKHMWTRERVDPLKIT